MADDRLTGMPGLPGLPDIPNEERRPPRVPFVGLCALEDGRCLTIEVVQIEAPSVEFGTDAYPAVALVRVFADDAAAEAHKERAESPKGRCQAAGSAILAARLGRWMRRQVWSIAERAERMQPSEPAPRFDPGSAAEEILRREA